MCCYILSGSQTGVMWDPGPRHTLDELQRAGPQGVHPAQLAWTGHWLRKARLRTTLSMAKLHDLRLSPLTHEEKLHLLNFSSASIFKVLQCRSKLRKILSECQIAWIRVRRQVTRRLIRIQTVCIWHYSCECRAIRIEVLAHSLSICSKYRQCVKQLRFGWDVELLDVKSGS